MEEAVMEKVSIEELLPQARPFIMVDELTEYEPEEAETSFTVREDSPLVCDGVLSTGGLVENIAQTSAARIGYYYKYVLRQPVKVGFIGAMRSFQVKRHPRVGETIRTRIHVIAEAVGMVAFAATVHDADGVQIARAEMKTAE